MGIDDTTGDTPTTETPTEPTKPFPEGTTPSTGDGTANNDAEGTESKDGNGKRRWGHRHDDDHSEHGGQHREKEHGGPRPHEGNRHHRDDH